MMTKTERRAFAVDRLEVRAADDGEAPMVRGHAAVFNETSENLGGFVERIAPGAFAASIGDGADVLALWSHRSDVVLGRTTAGTLSVREDDVGLAFDLSLPDTQAGRDLRVSLERGDVAHMSFGFVAERDAWDETGDVPVRTLEQVRLLEISPVAWPAYPQTDVALRSLDALRAARAAEVAAASAAKRISQMDERLRFFRA